MWWIRFSTYFVWTIVVNVTSPLFLFQFASLPQFYNFNFFFFCLICSLCFSFFASCCTCSLSRSLTLSLFSSPHFIYSFTPVWMLLVLMLLMTATTTTTILSCLLVQNFIETIRPHIARVVDDWTIFWVDGDCHRSTLHWVLVLWCGRIHFGSAPLSVYSCWFWPF